MKYVPLISAVLALLVMVSVPAYATDQIVQDPLAGDTTDVPDWALKPAEDPDDTTDDPVTPTDPITVRDEDGNIIYQDDGTVTEGFLLLFLILGFCLVIWKIVKGVL